MCFEKFDIIIRNTFACYYVCRALQMMTWLEVKCPVIEITLQQTYKIQEPKHLKSIHFSISCHAIIQYVYLIFFFSSNSGHAHLTNFCKKLRL